MWLLTLHSSKTPSAPPNVSAPQLTIWDRRIVRYLSYRSIGYALHLMLHLIYTKHANFLCSRLSSTFLHGIKSIFPSHNVIMCWLLTGRCWHHLLYSGMVSDCHCWCAMMHERLVCMMDYIPEPVYLACFSQPWPPITLRPDDI